MSLNPRQGHREEACFCSRKLLKGDKAGTIVYTIHNFEQSTEEPCTHKALSCLDFSINRTFKFRLDAFAAKVTMKPENVLRKMLVSLPDSFVQNDWPRVFCPSASFGLPGFLIVRIDYIS